MKQNTIDKHCSVTRGKLHVPCPYRESTGIDTHVVIKDGYCYRSDDCMIILCKYNRLQYDLDAVLSIVW
jgi:hypothetical protein